MSLLAVTGQAFAAPAETLVLDETAERVDLGSHWAYLTEEQPLTIDEVLGIHDPDRWQFMGGVLRSLGFRSTPHWFTVRVRNQSAQPQQYVLSLEFPDIDKLEYYLVSHNVILYHNSTGASRPFSSRELDHRNFVFPLPLGPRQTVQVFIRAETRGPLAMPLFVSTQTRFAKTEQEHLITQGLIVGAMGLLAFFQLFSYLSSGGLRQLLLAVYIISMTLFVVSANGLGFQFLWPNNPGFNLRATELFAWLSMLWGISYIVEFYDWRRRRPRWIIPVAIFLCIFSALYLLNFAMQATWLTYSLVTLNLLAFALYFLLALRVSLRGSLSDRFLGLALFALLLGGLVYLCYLFGWLEYTLGFAQAPVIGLALAAILMTLSLAEQVRHERVQQEMAYQRLLQHESELLALRESDLARQRDVYETLQERFQVKSTELSLALGQLQETRQRIESLGEYDGLTGVHTRRYFQNTLRERIAEFAQHEAPFSLLLLDIDDFRLLNETCGHVLGDECLRSLAVVLRGMVTRPSDLIARFGGEEFVVLLAATDSDGAETVAHKILSAVDGIQVGRSEREEPVGFSVSIGVASFVPSSNTDALACIEQAQIALRQAKQAGKGRVRVFNVATGQDES